MAMPPVRFDWIRYWVRRGESPRIENGYLVPPEGTGGWFGVEQNAELTTLEKLAEVPCLVLLGDVGLGKSVEIGREAERLKGLHSAEHRVLNVDLKRRSAEVIIQEVFESADFIGWQEGKHDLTLLFDSMDECWRRVTALGPLLLSHLKPHMTKEAQRKLAIRLSCRAAEWQDEIEAGLREMFGKDDSKNMQVWRLAPLTGNDVSLAAAQSGLEAQEFLSQVEANDVTALAAHPITLRMLLDLAKANQSLGKNRGEIYAAGCELLCRDTHQAKGATARLETTAQQRFELAGYLAAVGVLTNRYLIFGSCDERPTEETGILAGLDLAGHWVTGSGQQWELDRTALAETLQTGLFESQPNGFHTWRHQSYSEYLAARHLSERKLPAEQYVVLLCDTTSGRPVIWPQLEETAGWLVALVPALFERLVSNNADVFLRCDPARLDPAQRRMLVIGYLDQVRRNDGRIPFWNERVRLNRLKYEGIATDLEPVIRDAKETWVVRDLALDIAEACELRSLSGLYLDLFSNPKEEKRVRNAAGAALRDLASEEEKRRLKAIYREILENDPDDQARGYLLQLLWPKHLTLEELLPLLTLPKQDNFSGAYKHFLSDLFEKVAVADLPALLRWVTTVEPDHDHLDSDPYDGLCERITLAAYRNLANIDVQNEFFSLISSLTRRDGKLFRKDGRDLIAEEPLRQLFWREAIRRELELRKLAVYSRLDESGLIVAEDVRWLVDEVRAATGAVRFRWIELTLWLYAPVHFPAQLAWMQPLVDEDTEVAKMALSRTTSKLGGDEDGGENWQKEHYYKDLESRAERAKRPTFTAMVDDWLTQYEGGKVHFMWVLMEQLVRPVKDLGEEGYSGNDWGWNHITARQRERIRLAGPFFIEAIQIDSTKNDGTKPDFRPYWSGIRMMLELAEIKSSWLVNRDTAYWRTWAPLLFVYYDSVHRLDKEPWALLFGYAYQKAPEEFYTAFERWLVTRQTRYTPLQILDNVPAVNDPRVERIIMEVAVNASGVEANDFDLFSFLLTHGSKRAEAQLRTWRENGHKKSPMAEALLLKYCPEREGETVLTHMMSNKNLGRAVLNFLNQGGMMREGYIAKLTKESLARFWEWLDANFPKDPYFENSDGSVTLDHEIYHLKNGVLNYLENCGEDSAIAALGGLVQRHPEQPWLGQTLAKAKYVQRRKDWVPPLVNEMVNYLRVPIQKPLCSDADLCDALLVSLAKYQAKLKQDNPVRELWNEPAGPVKTWNPKEEEPISDCLARHIEADLAANKVTITRESQLRAKTGSAAGNFPDLMAYAWSASTARVQLKVPIEVKGTWHPKVIESIGEQLHDRYMMDARCGIHVTVYFTCSSWTDTDGRKLRGVSQVTPEELLRRLHAERNRVMSASGKRVEILLLDARL